VVIDISRREAVVSHTAGHKVSQDLWGIWSVKTKVIKLGEEKVEAWDGERMRWGVEGSGEEGGMRCSGGGRDESETR